MEEGKMSTEEEGGGGGSEEKCEGPEAKCEQGECEKLGGKTEEVGGGRGEFETGVAGEEEGSEEVLDQQLCLKDPMRDSLMSNSDQSDFSDDDDDDDDENDGTTIHGGSLADNNLNDLEFDMWQGQFEITKPASPRHGHTLYREIVKTVSKQISVVDWLVSQSTGI